MYVILELKEKKNIEQSGMSYEIKRASVTIKGDKDIGDKVKEMIESSDKWDIS